MPQVAYIPSISGTLGDNGVERHTAEPIFIRDRTLWYGYVSRSSGLAKTILQGSVKRGRRQGGQRKRWEDNIREWKGLEFGKSQRAVENRENGENWLQNHLWCPNDPRG